jgi:pyruvate/2-oxoglutarate dehydrogenase complex dihydrolipoamide dehydrogenase (E3) component
MPKSKVTYDFDLIVIGSGSGGSVGAHFAAKKGKKVAVFEKHKVLGGECPNWACVPTKALLHAAETYQTVLGAEKYGIKTGSVGFDYKKVKAWKDLVVSRTGTSEGDQAFAEAGIAVYHAEARFVNKHTITANGRRFTANKFLIASGTTDFIPPIEGLEKTGYITFRRAIDLEKLPKSIFVIGGGAIGVEFAHLFNSFGSDVTLLEVAPRLLGREEPEAADLCKAIFNAKGVNAITGGTIFEIRKHGDKKLVSYSDGRSNFVAEVDEILVAAGKKPNTDLGLENANVEFNKRGIITDNFMKTTTNNIFAAGDVVGPYQFTHTASYQSRLAAHNMYSRTNPIESDYTSIPRCVFMSPEIASVGLTEAEARAYKKPIKIGLVPISVVGRSNTSNQSTGFVKLVATQKGVIIGGTIVAPRAGEMIHEVALAIHNRDTAAQIASYVHAFPTWNEAIRVAATKIT